MLRIGRTKAYAMAREWRETGGRSGLPVVDFGNVLRVPRHALEELIGSPIVGISAPGTEPDSDQPELKSPGEPAAMPTPVPPPEPRSEPRRTVSHARSSSATRTRRPRTARPLRAPPPREADPR